MTELTRTAGLTPAGALAAAGPGTAVGRVLDPLHLVRPPVLGESIPGRVVAQGPQGRLAIASELGLLTLETAARLPAGTAVILQVRQISGALVVTVLPAERLQTTNGEPQPASQPGQQQEGGEAETGPPPGGTRSAPAGVAPRNPAEVLERGTTLRAVLLPPERAALESEAGRSLPRLPGALAYGRELSVRILLPGPGEDSQPMPEAVAQRSGRPLLPGRVIGQTEDGRPIIALALGRLVPRAPLVLPPRADLLLEIEIEEAEPALPSGAQAAALRPLSRLSAFGAALSHFESEPAAALLAALAVPRPGPRLAAALLHGLTSLAKGSASLWLGSAALAALEKVDPALARSLEREVQALARLSQETGGEWRLFLLPFLLDGQLLPLRLFLRSRGGGASEPAEAARRFRLELDFPRLGLLQLDGLVQRRRFDLVLRSRRAFTGSDRRALIELFAEANALGGLSGELSFDASDRWLPTALPEPAGAPSSLLA